LSFLRASYLAISVALLLAVTAGSASAATSVSSGGATVSISSDTTTIGPATRGLKATVTIVTGKKGARISLEFATKSFTRYIAKRPYREGAAMRVVGIDSISGPLRLIGSGSSARAGGFCGADFMPSRGESEDSSTYEVQVPASSTVTLTIDYEVVGDIPWANTDYSPRVVVGPLSSYGRTKRMTNPREWDYFKKSTVLTTSRPFIAIPLAGRVDLDMSPRPNTNYWGLGPVRAGKPIKLTGTLVPVRAGYPIEFWIDGRRVKKSLLTDVRGQVTHTITPSSNSVVTVRAAFPGIADGDLAPDPGCTIPIESAKAGSK
jgi:hypothetical protein